MTLSIVPMIKLVPIHAAMGALLNSGIFGCGWILSAYTAMNADTIA